jgi:hypothetical protein
MASKEGLPLRYKLKNSTPNREKTIFESKMGAACCSAKSKKDNTTTKQQSPDQLPEVKEISINVLYNEITSLCKGIRTDWLVK